MNDVLKTITNHRSIRKYTEEEVKIEDLEMIVKASQCAPSSINGQHVSIISINNREKREKLMQLSGDQHWILDAPVFLVFCSDFYRAHLAAKKNQVSLEATNSLESTLVGFVDVGLAMQNAITAAESLGYGTVPIGGIRNHPLKVTKLLDLPEYVFPVCGLCIGKIKDPSQIKPRLPKEAVYHEDTYNKELNDLIDDYDLTMSKYMLERTDGKSDRNWTTTIANFYKNKSQRDIKQAMKNQGYKNE